MNALLCYAPQMQVTVVSEGQFANGAHGRIRLFVLRETRPDAERPYRAFGYPFIPGHYIIAACFIMQVLILYRTPTTWPGLVIVLSGIPIYFLGHRAGVPRATQEAGSSETGE